MEGGEGGRIISRCLCPIMCSVSLANHGPGPYKGLPGQVHMSGCNM